jgi:hypothetical protein
MAHAASSFKKFAGKAPAEEIRWQSTSGKDFCGFRASAQKPQVNQE